MRKNNLFKKILTTAVITTMAFSLIACGGKKETNNTEPTTKTDIVAVEIVDEQGSKHTLEGVGVTDENGKTTITVTDKDGNKTVIEGTASTDENGKTTVTGGTVVQGGTITKDDGTKVDTNTSKVEDVKDNNDGKIDTDVKVDETIKAEVESKKENATKENATKEEATKEKETTNVANKETVAPTTNVEKETENVTESPSENETVAPVETERETTTPTETPTTKPVETTKPTEAPTVKPLTEEEILVADMWKCVTRVEDMFSKIEILVDWSKYNHDKIIIPAQSAIPEDLVIKYDRDKKIDISKPMKVTIADNAKVKEIIILSTNADVTVANNANLVKYTTYAKKLSDGGYLSNNPKLKELNLMNGNIEYITTGWIKFNRVTCPGGVNFSGATVNINMKSIDSLIATEDIRKYVAGKATDNNVSFDLAFFNTFCGMNSSQGYSPMFSKVNFLK